MIGGYLAILDTLLAEGCASFSEAYRDRQADWLAGLQQPDGGFAGRLGRSDIYYTDFAIRSISLLNPNSEAMPRAAKWLAAQPTPSGVIDCFCLLNAARALSRCGVAFAPNHGALVKVLEANALPNGGYARPGDSVPSAYYSFLGGLCGETLERAPSIDAEAIASLQCADGGFADAGDGSIGQTNSTAAAVGLLTLCGALDAGVLERAAAFLSRMQAADGGWLAHADAPMSDLLSTFTALWTLMATGQEARANIRGAGRYVASLARAEGGFIACALDTEADVEYAYYGLASIALLKAYVLNRG